jgi:hypothetical protein
MEQYYDTITTQELMEQAEYGDTVTCVHFSYDDHIRMSYTPIEGSTYDVSMTADMNSPIPTMSVMVQNHPCTIQNGYQYKSTWILHKSGENAHHKKLEDSNMNFTYRSASQQQILVDQAAKSSTRVEDFDYSGMPTGRTNQPTQDNNMTTVNLTSEELKAALLGDKKVKVTKTKTDLQKIKKVTIIAVYINENGSEAGIERLTGKSAEKDAFAKLNSNKYRGCSVATFKASQIKRAAVQLENV